MFKEIYCAAVYTDIYRVSTSSAGRGGLAAGTTACPFAAGSQSEDFCKAHSVLLGLFSFGGSGGVEGIAETGIKKKNIHASTQPGKKKKSVSSAGEVLSDA